MPPTQSEPLPQNPRTAGAGDEGGELYSASGLVVSGTLLCPPFWVLVPLCGVQLTVGSSGVTDVWMPEWHTSQQ